MTTFTSVSPRQELISAIKDERARTKRVLNAFPAKASELRPHPTSATAREVAHIICTEADVSTLAVNGPLDVSKMNSMPPAPETWSEVLKEFDTSYDKLVKALEHAHDDDLNKTSKFLTGPRQMEDVPRIDIVKFMLNDHIHHRGQLSVYLRMSGAKVPSIYGPSKDEPWN
jgi:uncharacterized damage-inducible protein DinB